MRSKKTNIQQHSGYKKFYLQHRQAAAWNDDKIITHFRNTLKKEMIDWFYLLPALNVSQLVWAEIPTRFEIDFNSKATATSIVDSIKTPRSQAGS